MRAANAFIGEVLWEELADKDVYPWVVRRFRDSDISEIMDWYRSTDPNPFVAPLYRDNSGSVVTGIEVTFKRVVGELAFAEVARINAVRADRWHRGFPNHTDGWTGADWSNAMQGEAGEAGNVVKKLRRIDTGIAQAEYKGQTVEDARNALREKLATEIGDTYLYLDLLAQFYGLDVATCVRETFNRVSEREGFPERI